MTFTDDDLRRLKDAIQRERVIPTWNIAAMLSRLEATQEALRLMSLLRMTEHPDKPLTPESECGVALENLRKSCGTGEPNERQ